MRSTPAAVLCIEAVPTADLDPAGAAALGRRVAEQIVAPTVRLHGGRTDGVLGTRIVASFPDSEAARRGAEAVLSVAEWDLDDAALRMGLSTDPDGAALPSAAAVARAARWGRRRFAPPGAGTPGTVPWAEIARAMEDIRRGEAPGR